MKSYRIGDIIHAKRIELDLTQEQLCDGICEPSTMSKIENGKQMPSMRRLEVLLQRMGLSGERFLAMVSEQEFELQDLKHEIKRLVMQRENKKALELLKQLESSFDQTDSLTLQFVIFEKSIIGHMVDDCIVPYCDDELISMLYQAIKITIPKFDEEKISEFLLGTSEIQIILNIAIYYSHREEYEKSILIYEELMDYINKHCMSMEEIAYILPLIAYDYASDLGKTKEYQKAYDVSEIGRKCCVQHKKTSLLGQLLINQGCSLHEMGKTQECIRKMKQAYYILDALEENSNCEIIKNYLFDNFNCVVD